MPGRAAENASKAAQQTYMNQSNQSFQGSQADIGQAESETANLRAGKSAGANPYFNPQYLAAVNRLRSGSLNEATNAGDRDIRALNARTGGMNSTATAGAISDNALRKARLGSTLGSEQAAQDWTKNIGYQLNFPQMALAQAGARGGLYGTATKGQSDALNNMTQEEIAKMQAQAQLASSAISAVGGAGAAALMPRPPQPS